MVWLMSHIFGWRSELHRTAVRQSFCDDHESLKKSVLEIEERRALNTVCVMSYAWACLYTKDAQAGLAFVSRNHSKYDKACAAIFEGCFLAIQQDDEKAIDILTSPTAMRFQKKRRSNPFEGQRCYTLGALYFKQNSYGDAMAAFCRSLGHFEDTARVFQAMVGTLNAGSRSEREDMVRIVRGFQRGRRFRLALFGPEEIREGLELVLDIGNRLLSDKGK